MEQHLKTTEHDPLAESGPDDELPPGDHALEVAARNGFGPLSPMAKRVWHGDAIPCVTCGQLVHRDDDRCYHCGQDLRDEMIEKMRAHAGPWYVLEHLRPFPGVALDRIVRQIRRGLITETSIVRGPSTDYQWRFAVETPGICRYFAKCWHCHHAVNPADAYCQSCLSHLSFEKPRPLSAPPATLPEPQASAHATTPQTPSGHGVEATRPTTTPAHSEPRASARAVAPVLVPGSELAKLASAVNRLEAIPATDSKPPSRTSLIAVSLIVVALVVAIIGMLWVASLRRQVTSLPTPATASLLAPASP